MPRAERLHAQNNFDLLRLIFAFGVALYHLTTLSQARFLAPFTPGFSIGAELGVAGFFVISGYLVYASLERSQSLSVYFTKRARRLLPAYSAVILLSAAGAVLFSADARADLLGVARYLAANLVFLNFLEPGLPGVFQSNPVTAVNGALWTLKIEVLFYCLLPVLAYLINSGSERRARAALGLVYVLAEIWRGVFGAMHGSLRELAHQLPGQLNYFVVGIGLMRFQNRISLNWAYALAGFSLLVGSYYFDFLAPARALGLGIFVIWLATGIPVIMDLSKIGDLSYGTYILHFPIIQTFVAAGVFSATPMLGAVLAVVCVLFSAALTWRLVERRWLQPTRETRLPACT